MKIAILAVMVSISASVAAGPRDVKASSPIELAQQRVVNALRDPDSAKFGQSFAGSSAVCGTVNAKNAMGGYAGPRRFIVTSERVMIEDDAGSTAFDYRWSELCTDDLAATRQPDRSAK